MSSIKEALEQIVRELEYCRDHGYAPDLTTIRKLKTALATFQPDSERREAIAFKIYSHSNNPKLWDHPNSVLARDNAYSIADLLLVSGLVQENKK